MSFRNQYGDPALIHAIKAKRLDAVELLVQRGADVNVQNTV